jgi:hypothetical protein
MKTGKDIPALFREGAQGLKVQPSPHAWQRLERQLEKHPPNGRVVLMRWVMAVAAMLVLSFGLYWWSGTVQSGMVSLLQSPPPASMEELADSGGCEPYCLMLKSRQELPAYYAFPEQKSW